MSDVFISYARSTADQAQQIAEALRSLGYRVWRDDELPAHRSYAEVIEERLEAAKAVVVLWSAEAVKSEWVQSEADRARTDRKLVQIMLDGATLPMPFDRIQCADLAGWSGDQTAPAWRKVAASIAELAGPVRKAAAHVKQRSICVLPFANMSDDPQQEYFSDGITEDIITDLSKISALAVASRNTAFTFKGKSVNVADVARQLGVTHVLEGSVRKAGARVRITAQLIEGSSDSHVWAERYDRDLDDIFALQDEISEAIVAALKLRLLPEEKKAIEKRGTNSAEAYDLYLMARQHYLTGNFGDIRREEAIARLCRRATEIDPGYARAWALLAAALRTMRFKHNKGDDDGLAAAERALALDPDLAEAHSAKSSVLFHSGRREEALAEMQIALRLDPESYDVQLAAATHHYKAGRFREAAEHEEKAIPLGETDYDAALMLGSCRAALGDAEGARQVARFALARAEAVVAQDRSNGSAMAAAVFALATLGEADRARDWARRALVVDPDNLVMHYNIACAFCAQLGDLEMALELLGPVMTKMPRDWLIDLQADPDLEPLRADPRYTALVADAEARLSADA
jgi:adenylate cyclase